MGVAAAPFIEVVQNSKVPPTLYATKGFLWPLKLKACYKTVSSAQPTGKPAVCHAEWQAAVQPGAYGIVGERGVFFVGGAAW
jgi:hypothetical protein